MAHQDPRFRSGYVPINLPPVQQPIFPPPHPHAHPHAVPRSHVMPPAAFPTPHYAPPHMQPQPGLYPPPTPVQPGPSRLYGQHVPVPVAPGHARHPSIPHSAHAEDRITDIMDLHNALTHRGRMPPDYRDGMTGRQDRPIWWAEVIIDGVVWRRAEGETKKLARHAAARQALCALRRQYSSSEENMPHPKL